MPVRPEYYQAAPKSSPFYGEVQGMAARAGHSLEPLQTHELPAKWLLQAWDCWEGWTPRSWEPRVQGWKIHISATPACARETLARTTKICTDLGVAFKFLPTLAELTDSSAKHGARGGSGKFITIYPDDDEQLATLLTSLAEALSGQSGPYILSDLRFVDDAPVFVRYGAITGMRKSDDEDEIVECIVDPERLTLVPDMRQPSFTIPAGTKLPDILADAYRRAQEDSPSRLDEFTSIKPLHFSNAGGVYLAELPSGEKRVLREARPHAGLDARNRCALERQKTEEQVLRDLADVPAVQHLRGVFTAWEHRYLELDYIDGVTLTSWVVRNVDLQESDPAEYARQATAIIDQVVDVVEQIHQRGWAFGDLHPGNILVSPDDVVHVLDLEDATRLAEAREVGFRVFEYCADDSLDAEQADWFAVARSILLMYVADFEIEAVAPGFVERALQRIGQVYGARAGQQVRDVWARFSGHARPVLASDVVVEVPDAPLEVDTAIDALFRGITWSRQFSTDGHSYPGDPAATGSRPGETYGSGRAGVILAQHRAGSPVDPADVDTLCTVAGTWGPQDDPGLINGLAGIALTLSELGRHEVAVEAARSALEAALGRYRLDLHGGLAGVVLAALEVATTADDDALRSRALWAYDHLHRTVGTEGPERDALCRRRGYYWGLTGLALTDLVAHVVTGDPALLDRARDRIRADLDECMLLDSGELMVRDVQNNRALPYVEWGSAGLLLISSIYERVSGQELLSRTERDGAITACSGEFYIYPSLDHGRAGIAVTLAAAGAAHRAEADRQVCFLLDSLLVHEDKAFSIGDGLIRLSSDLSTGAAGVALTLHAHRTGSPYLTLPISERTARAFHALALPEEAAVPASELLAPRTELVA